MDIVTEDGEIVSPETVEYAYTREGRKEIGKEYPNPVPMEAPIGHVPYEDIWVTMKRLVLDHARRQAEEDRGDEMDSPEEADDFEVGDDYDPASPWEENFEPTDPWPMSTAARQLEQAIAEKRNQGRIAILKEELDALQNGKEWPAAPVASPPPDKPLTEPNKP